MTSASSGSVEDIELGELGTLGHIDYHHNKQIEESESEVEDDKARDMEDEENYFCTKIGCQSERSIWWTKFILNFVLPVLWVGGGGYVARDFFTSYYSDDDQVWTDLGYNDVDQDVILFCITSMIMAAGGILLGCIFLYFKMVRYRKYLEITLSASIFVLGMVVMNAFGSTTNTFYYSYLNGWAIATVSFAFFMLVYHVTVYVDYVMPCCCQGDGCCDWNYEFSEETDSEIDRLESLGIEIVQEDKRDSNQEQAMNNVYKIKMQERAEKRDRRRARESMRKERRKRHAERLRAERKALEEERGKPVFHKVSEAIFCW
jgi:hypothetical protein